MCVCVCVWEKSSANATKVTAYEMLLWASIKDADMLRSKVRLVKDERPKTIQKSAEKFYISTF